jgi:hypothetical protein
MSSPTDKLIGVRAKIERAKEHVHNLEAAVQAFRDSNPYGFRIEDDLKTGDKIHRIHIQSQTPDSFALLIGDAVHNLRAALDYLAWQLVIANGQTPKAGSNGTQFPIYNPSPKTKTHQGVIQGISPGAQKVLDSLKPYRGGNDDLWNLHQLDISDKHKLLLVTAFALSQIMPTWKGPTHQWRLMRALISSLKPVGEIVDLKLTAEIHATHPQHFSISVPVGVQDDGRLPILDDGTIVARIIAPIQEEAKFDLAFEITINEPQIVDGKPVLPFIHQLINLVDSIVNKFVPFL